MAVEPAPDARDRAPAPRQGSLAARDLCARDAAPSAKLLVLMVGDWKRDADRAVLGRGAGWISGPPCVLRLSATAHTGGDASKSANAGAVSPIPFAKLVEHGLAAMPGISSTAAWDALVHGGLVRWRIAAVAGPCGARPPDLILLMRL